MLALNYIPGVVVNVDQGESSKIFFTTRFLHETLLSVFNFKTKVSENKKEQRKII